jgi:hypothetical protein
MGAYHSALVFAHSFHCGGGLRRERSRDDRPTVLFGLCKIAKSLAEQKSVLKVGMATGMLCIAGRLGSEDAPGAWGDGRQLEVPVNDKQNSRCNDN